MTWRRQKQVDVARKNVSCWQKELMLQEKIIHVDKNKMMMCSKKLLIFPEQRAIEFHKKQDSLSSLSLPNKGRDSFKYTTKRQVKQFVVFLYEHILGNDKIKISHFKEITCRAAVGFP